jgi:hypothetical protein
LEDRNVGKPKESPMSLIANLSSAPSALPPVNVHPHGHKRGSHIESTDDSGSETAAQIPPGTAQNLFGSLLHSLEQIIGVQPATAAAATSAGTTANTTAASSSAGAGGQKFVGSNLNVNA